MNYRQLGRTGVLLPEIGIGAWDYHAGAGPLRRAIEAGAAFIDTAESYGTEEVIGVALAGWRGSVFVATKVSPRNFHPRDLKRSAEASLLRLGLDTIDLLQLHEPGSAMPLAETLGAMEDLVDAGTVRFIGVSNFSKAQLQEAQSALKKHPLVSNQVRYNLIDRTIEKDLLPYCHACGVTVIAYSPLARGLGRILDCDPDGVLARLAGLTGNSPAQIALNWCLSRNGVVAIPKSNSEEHMLENCAASGWHLSPEQVYLLDTAIRWRRRGALDRLVRRALPGGLRPLAVKAANYLPRGIRRRLV